MRRKSISRFSLIMLIVLISVVLPLSTACAPKAAGQVIEVGVFAEFTGNIATQAIPAIKGCMDYMAYLNEKEGGIKGIRIEPLWSDCAYSLPRAITAYKRFKEDGAVLTFNWSSSYNEGLRPTWEKDKIASVSNAVTVPALYPPGPIFVDRVDYASMFGGFIDWLVGQWWKESRRPKVALMAWDSPFGKGPLPAIPYAQSKGVEIVATEVIPYMPTDTTVELLRCRDAGADFIFSNVIAAPVSVIVKDAYRLGLSTAAGGKMTIVPGMQAGPEELIPLAKEAAEGTIGMQSTAMWNDTEPGVSLAKEVQERFHGAVAPSSSYFWGWNLGRIGCEGIRIALDDVGYGKLDGAAVWKGLENIKNLDMGGIIPTVTLSATERRGSMSVRMYQVKNGQPVWVSSWVKCPDLLAEAAKAK